MALESADKVRRYTEDTLKLAVEDVRENRLTLRKASLHYGVPKSTLKAQVWIKTRSSLSINTRRGEQAC